MNAGPYSDQKVQQYIEDQFIPLKSQCFWDNRTELMKRFDIAWTPTLLVLDPSAREHRRIIGFVPTDDFMAHLKLGKGMMLFNRFRFAESSHEFNAVIEQHPDSLVVPEAVFFLGVAGYWKSHEARFLRQAYDRLIEHYPQSEWARRATPYAQIAL
jgi:hypothetical protein